MTAVENYKAFKFKINKQIRFKKLIQTTDMPFSWFPELENLFRHFNIKNLEFEIDNKQIVFLIEKIKT